MKPLSKALFSSFILILLAPASPLYADAYKTQNRIFVHYTETKSNPGPGSFKDNNYANMRLLGFTQDDVNTLENECKAYFAEYYGIDFHNIPPLADGSILLADASAMMFPEKIPDVLDSRVVLDTANKLKDNNARRSYVIKDTGCALAILTSGTGVYGGINAGMPRAANDLIIYGYANIFNPQKPIHKDNLIERIKFKPAWPIRMTPVANAQGLNLVEAVFKVEAEYIDKQGRVHEGIGISGYSQRMDKNGGFHQSKRTVYTFS